MESYKKLDKNNAGSFFNEYINNKDTGLLFLKKNLIENGLGEESFDFSPKSLITIWELIHPQLVRFEEVDTYKDYENELPIWMPYGFGFWDSSGGYTFESTHLLDGLAYYFSEVFLKNIEKSSWDISHLTGERMIGAYEPVIRVRPKNIWSSAMIFPLSIIQGEALNTWLYIEDLAPTNLYDRYQYYIELFINSEPPPPQKSEFKEQYPKLAKKLSDFGIYELDELVEIKLLSKDNRVIMDGIECNKRFITSSALEMIIGDKNFRKIATILMSIEGIKFAAQEDREVFYLKSTMSKKKLQAAILNKIEMSMI